MNEFMTTAPSRAYTVPTSNSASLRVLEQPFGSTIEAVSGDHRVDVFLSDVDHHRLAVHLALALGFGPVGRTLAWTLAGPGGLWVGTSRDDGSWWAISADDPGEQAVLTDAEALWPLTWNAQRYQGGDGACLYGAGPNGVLTHCHKGKVYTEDGDRTTLYHADGSLYHLEQMKVNPVLPRESVRELDLRARQGWVLVRPQGLVLSDGEEYRAVVLNRENFSTLVHALSATLPIPEWILRDNG